MIADLFLFGSDSICVVWQDNVSFDLFVWKFSDLSWSIANLRICSFFEQKESNANLAQTVPKNRTEKSRVCPRKLACKKDCSCCALIKWISESISEKHSGQKSTYKIFLVSGLWFAVLLVTLSGKPRKTHFFTFWLN